MIDTQYLRVKQTDTGHELTVSKTQYDFAPDAYEVLEGAATDSGNNPLPPVYFGQEAAADPAAWDDHLVAELQAEIDRRNTSRDPEGDDYIRPDGTKKADLASALEADDANSGL